MYSEETEQNERDTTNIATDVVIIPIITALLITFIALSEYS